MAVQLALLKRLLLCDVLLWQSLVDPLNSLGRTLVASVMVSLLKGTHFLLAVSVWPPDELAVGGTAWFAHLKPRTFGSDVTCVLIRGPHLLQPITACHLRKRAEPNQPTRPGYLSTGRCTGPICGKARLQ